MNTLLDKTRKLTEMLKHKGSHSMQFTELCNLLSGLIESDVYIISAKGKILGVCNECQEDIKVGNIIDSKINIRLLLTDMTNVNIYDSEMHIFGTNSIITVIPVVCAGERLGTMVLKREKEEFKDDDLIIAEYASTIFGMEILRSDKEKQSEKRRKAVEVKLAAGSLSYSELEAVKSILDEIKSKEGILVTSRIADREGITRSVIVNALRKLESAGVIETRSLGMKGTLIKIINEKVLEEFKKR